MTLIADTESLAAFCQRQIGADYVAVDTEFMRDKTYWPQLCLVQVAGPEEAAAIDPLAPGMDLAPLLELMFDERIVKVFHAARQDIEIFYHLTGRIPEPLFDTQVAAMVCGFGEAVSYENLATKLAGARIDKSSRFTDWAQRPLTPRQLTYALSDVTHLRPTYEKLRRRLEKSGRGEWLDEEMNVLLEPGTYRLEPAESWRRFKVRGGSGRFLAVLKEVAAWRERTAQDKDMPRGRILRDEAVLEIAAHHPASVDDLARTRGLGKGLAEGRFGSEILEAVHRGLALPEADLPQPPPRQDMPPGLGPLCDLLRVLLKMQCEEHDVAQKLVASADDLERIAASDDADVPALEGWRREIFGQHALALKHGKLGLTAHGKSIAVVDLGRVAV
ncbi:ribonuclease D [Stella humosa]|uniref:Ribonuclease D n=1 Tax=Stella humosa TaxID=94 RepID=A0A3N1MEA0_9PROT|nr:ribonuclease D [Stella humosa]ROP99495.1 ribonuclease D [Stella humosa]BBK31291.1 ribonuclease D [Stella humosa]